MTQVIFIAFLLEAVGWASRRGRGGAPRSSRRRSTGLRGRPHRGLRHAHDLVCRLPGKYTSFIIKYECRTTPRTPAVSRIAAAIGEPARARMLYCLMDGQARTSTELAVGGGREPVDRERPPESAEGAAPGEGARPGEASLLQPGGTRGGPALEALSVLAGGLAPVRSQHARAGCVPRRTCYDHLAGTLGVALLRSLAGARLAVSGGRDGDGGYDLTPDGTRALSSALGIDVAGDSRAASPASPTPASTGASAGRIWAARSARRCSDGRAEEELGRPDLDSRALGSHEPRATRAAGSIRPARLRAFAEGGVRPEGRRGRGTNP